MSDAAGDLLGPLLPVLAATLGVAALLRRLGLSTIAGYLAAGSLLGPFGLGWLRESPLLTALADVGVAFLLFTIGLELSLPRLRTMARLVFGLGALQVGVSVVVVAALALWMGAALGAALVLGGVVAMSSTAMGLKELHERGELDAPHGRAALGTLLFQDLATVGFLALLAALRAGEPTGDLSITRLLIEGGWRIALLAGVVFVGHTLARPALRSVAATHSPELLLLAALTVALGAAWAAQLAGVSGALGAFLAGTMLAETEFRHQLEADIRPFRDVLLGLFFLTTGALLEPGPLVSQGATIAWLLAAIVLGKAASIAGFARAFGLDRASALRTGLALAHVGEFGLLLLGVGLREDLIPAPAGQVLLATATLGFVSGSIFTRHNQRIAASILRWLPVEERGPDADSTELAAAGGQLRDHVIICGYGRVGQSVAHVLTRQEIAWIALDLDPKRVVDAHRGGDAVYLANAAVPDVLLGAGLARARGIVVAFDDAPVAERIARTVRARRGPACPLVVRVRDEEALEGLVRAGATLALPVALEASLGLAMELLIALGRSPAETARLAQEIRRERYASLRTYYPGSTDAEPSDEDSRPRHRHSVVVPQRGELEGQRLDELDLGRASLALRLRAGEVVGDEEPIAGGDVIVLEGPEGAIAEVVDRLGAA